MLTFKEYVSTLLDLTEEEWAFFSQRLTPRTFQKGDMICRPGEVCQSVLFVQEGLAYSYMLDPSGKQFIWEFYYNSREAAMGNLFAVDCPSFMFRQPGQFYIEALSAVQGWTVDLQGVREIFDQNDKWRQLGSVVGSMANRDTQNRAVSLLSEPATDRYQRLVREMPALLQLVPLRHIAAYLGITPQSLSRLRKNMAVIA